MAAPSATLQTSVPGPTCRGSGGGCWGAVEQGDTHSAPTQSTAGRRAVSDAFARRPSLPDSGQGTEATIEALEAPLGELEAALGAAGLDLADIPDHIGF